jgi:hypothetical protein
MHDLHAYARARQFELEHALRQALHGIEAQRAIEPRPRGKLIRLILGESPQARAA